MYSEKIATGVTGAQDNQLNLRHLLRQDTEPAGLEIEAETKTEAAAETDKFGIHF